MTRMEIKRSARGRNSGRLWEELESSDIDAMIRDMVSGVVER